jgi:hypothetical protein
MGLVGIKHIYYNAVLSLKNSSLSLLAQTNPRGYCGFHTHPQQNFDYLIMVYMCGPRDSERRAHFKLTDTKMLVLPRDIRLKIAEYKIDFRQCLQRCGQCANPCLCLIRGEMQTISKFYMYSQGIMCHSCAQLRTMKRFLICTLFILFTTTKRARSIIPQPYVQV